MQLARYPAALTFLGCAFIMLQAGDRILQLACQRRMSLQEVVHLNPDLDVDNISVGQILWLVSMPHTRRQEYIVQVQTDQYHLIHGIHMHACSMLHFSYSRLCLPSWFGFNFPLNCRLSPSNSHAAELAFNCCMATYCGSSVLF